MSETKKFNNAKKVVDILGKVEKNTKVLLLSDQETEKNRRLKLHLQTYPD